MTHWPFFREYFSKTLKKQLLNMINQLISMAMDFLTITQKVVNIWNNYIAAATDHAALRVSVMHGDWML